MRTLLIALLSAVVIAGCGTLSDLTSDQREVARICAEFSTTNQQITCISALHEEIANVAETIDENLRRGSLSQETAEGFYEALLGTRQLLVTAEDLLLVPDVAGARGKLDAALAALDLLEERLQ